MFGLERAGVGRAVWHAEVDPHASRVLAERWPGVPNHGDLKTACWERVEPVDILVGGYPCQPFSHAGQRRGTEDERHLWPHVLNTLRVLRPPLALFENVAGHVSLGLDVVLRDLAEVGFDAWWGTVRASDLGAPHRRERLFIAAADAEDERQQRSGLTWDWRAGLADSRVGRSRRGHADGRRESASDATGDQGRLSDRDSEAAADAEHDGRDGHAFRRCVGVCQEPGGVLESEGRDPAAWGDYEPAIRRWERLTRTVPSPVDDRGQLDPRFVEWMMGFPEGFVTDLLPRTAALRCLGNAVVPQVAEWVGGQIGTLSTTPQSDRVHSDRSVNGTAPPPAERALWPERTVG